MKLKSMIGSLPAVSPLSCQRLGRIILRPIGQVNHNSDIHLACAITMLVFNRRNNQEDITMTEHPIPQTMGQQFGRRPWAESWKNKMVEPIKMIDRAQRERALNEAGF